MKTRIQTYSPFPFQNISNLPYKLELTAIEYPAAIAFSYYFSKNLLYATI